MVISRTGSHAIQLFEPPVDAVYTIEATSRLTSVSRRTILVYCKHQLLSPAIGSSDHGYYFGREAIRALRRIEALRTICGDDFAGMKIILELTAALERLRSDIRLLSSRTKSSGSAERIARESHSFSFPRAKVKSNPRRKRK